jgi:hypothetical protein
MLSDARQKSRSEEAKNGVAETESLSAKDE